MLWKLERVLVGFPAGGSNKGSLGMSSVMLATDGKKKVLFDTAAFGARGWVLRSLEELGVKPEEIDIVCLTHLHFDHCVNVDAFPNAELIFSDIEWKYANETDDIFVEKVIIKEISQMKYRLISDGDEILPGITSMITPGHTPGGVSYFIDTVDGKVAFAGDAIKNRTELSQGTVVMSYDHDLSYRSIMKVREKADYVFPGHDCMMCTKGDNVIPTEENSLIIPFQTDLYVNEGKSNMKIQLDAI